MEAPPAVSGREQAAASVSETEFCVSEGIDDGLLEKSEFGAVSSCQSAHGLPEGIESDFSKILADITASNSDPVMGATAGATAGEDCVSDMSLAFHLLIHLGV